VDSRKKPISPLLTEEGSNDSMRLNWGPGQGVGGTKSLKTQTETEHVGAPPQWQEEGPSESPWKKKRKFQGTQRKPRDLLVGGTSTSFLRRTNSRVQTSRGSGQRSTPGSEQEDRKTSTSQREGTPIERTIQISEVLPGIIHPWGESKLFSRPVGEIPYRWTSSSQKKRQEALQSSLPYTTGDRAHVFPEGEGLEKRRNQQRRGAEGRREK